MKLSTLLYRLQQIALDHGNLDISIMQETTLPAHLPVMGEKQVESEVKDIAVCGGRIVIIGNELD